MKHRTYLFFVVDALKLHNCPTTFRLSQEAPVVFNTRTKPAFETTSIVSLVTPDDQAHKQGPEVWTVSLVSFVTIYCYYRFRML
jgi:hypothetical protein